MKKCFLTERGPKAIGPYSTATQVGSLCFMSGMLGVVPEKGALAEGGVEAQAKQALSNIRTVLEEMDLTMEAVAKTTVFLADLSDFAKVNAVYETFFEAPYPARSCVQVAAIPKGAKVEIECIAKRD